MILADGCDLPRHLDAMCGCPDFDWLCLQLVLEEPGAQAVGPGPRGSAPLRGSLVDTQRYPSGEVEVDGENVLAMDEQQLRDLRRFKMSMVFQKFALLPHRTVIENVQYGLEIQGREAEHFTPIPDFSATGDTLWFGYERANSNTNPDALRENVHGIDNWQVTVSFEPGMNQPPFAQDDQCFVYADSTTIQ